MMLSFISSLFSPQPKKELAKAEVMIERWPAYSLDLNLIDDLFALAKHRTGKKYRADYWCGGDGISRIAIGKAIAAITCDGAMRFE